MEQQNGTSTREITLTPWYESSLLDIKILNNEGFGHERGSGAEVS